MLYSNTTGNYNVAFGESALLSNTTGCLNVGIGKNALYNNTVGSCNTFIGNNVYNTNNTISNVIAIGSNIDGVEMTKNTVYIGTDNSTNLIYNDLTSGSWAYASDRRIKENIEDSTVGLSFINNLRPVVYNLKNPADYPTEILDKKYKQDKVQRPEDNIKIQRGFIAQEVMEAVTSSGMTEWPALSVPDNENEIARMSETTFIHFVSDTSGNLKPRSIYWHSLIYFFSFEVLPVFFISIVPTSRIGSSMPFLYSWTTSRVTRSYSWSYSDLTEYKCQTCRASDVSAALSRILSNLSILSTRLSSMN